MHSKAATLALAASTTLALMTHGSAALAGSQIDIEAVDAYPAACTTLNNNIANVDNFRSRMLSIAGFGAGIRYTNNLVFATDFIDPQRAGGGGGIDYANFDRSNSVSAIAFFSGHGLCDDQTNTTCLSASGCPPIAGLQASCLRQAENPLFGVTGACSYSRPRKLMTAQPAGGSCMTVDYSSGPVGFGESAARTFGGVGTDGGVNFAVLDVSCGITPGFGVFDFHNMYAGVTTIASLMPTRFGDDTVDTSTRGKAWADLYVANPSSHPAAQWASAINGTSDGAACYFGGGSHGFSGCGAAMSIAVDWTQSAANWAITNETWAQVRDDTQDASGYGYYAYIYQCNYDCNAHPILL